MRLDRCAAFDAPLRLEIDTPNCSRVVSVTVLVSALASTSTSATDSNPNPEPIPDFQARAIGGAGASAFVCDGASTMRKQTAHLSPDWSCSS